MKIYRTEMTLVGTIYVTAKDSAQAMLMARDFANDVFFFEGESISGVSFHSKELPEVSLAPAFTGFGLCDEEEIEEVGEVADA